MTTYAIGDLQGCHREFVALLERLDFAPSRDTLWLAGDLVNRGPGSLDCLREVVALGDSVQVVLGNHDLHLLAVARGNGTTKRSDTLATILEAPDREALLDWLQQQPLMVRASELEPGEQHDTVMCHAGLLPQWSVAKASALAGEVEARLADDNGDFLSRMYGNHPSHWQDDLDGMDRARFIVNAFTRMRFVDPDGQLEFAAKEGLDSEPKGFAPWFSYSREDDPHILFGHWAALEGGTPGSRVRAEALDTGCVWGGSLTALDLSTGKRISQPSLKGV
ncbi:symmetrical bis(5'-nucleosyl)-tetraphosphatase [Onishia niordana]|uniref:symmetrical bis(5'-nucleosyl)-tetraphosphatase n=1 Tax=Onishia niordana TaxID=2508711 RepID=UPI00109F76BB|nr:symmetrical bis(5'-nucleosyl)-tetraphosphatase [Halomonas niordiana]